MRRPLVFHGLLVIVAIALDQWIKWLVETRMDFQVAVELLPFLALYRTYNTGVAFSMFSGADDIWLILLVVAVMAFILWLAWKSEARQVWARLGFALIIAGAIGNLIDRSLLGHVVDYVLFHTPVWSFAVFNLADVYITVGAGLVLLQELIDWRRAPPAGSSN